ncbi:hypothetical protein [Actinoplanes sp. URMC 104]|uniref:hypothetical protein n=1 Tax=Actinoplanes sp. URMC 104 TaxID=3423409 RepID=UPI003F19AB44
MGISAQPVGDVHVLGHSRLWPAIAVPGAAAVVLAIISVALRAFPLLPIGLVAAALMLALVRRRNAVLADDLGLLVRTRAGTTRSYAWTEIDRMGWHDNGLLGSVLEIYPRGGPYDVPGPNSSVFVGRIWRPRRRRHPDPLPELMERHGIKTLIDR